MDDRELKQAMLDLVQAVDLKGAESRPEVQEDMTNGRQVVAALLIGCVRLSRAIYLLLLKDLADEAKILFRTLLQDSTTLAYLHRHGDQLEALALRLISQSLLQQKGLEEQAASLNLKRPAGRLAQIDEDLAKVRRLVEEQGIGRLTKLPDVNAMLKEMDAGKLYWFYQSASHYVHSSTFGLASRLEWETERVTVRMESDLPSLIQVGALTAESLLTALIASAHLLAWDSVDELGTFRNQIRPIIGELLKHANASNTQGASGP